MLRENGWQVTTVKDYRSAVSAASQGTTDAVIAVMPTGTAASADANAELNSLIRVLEARRISGLIVTDDPKQCAVYDASPVDAVDRRVSVAELRGRLAMIARYRGLLRMLDAELNHMQRLGIRLSEHFNEVDQEMRLAGRLQRDFLPNLELPIGNVQFASVYRPVSWVSGDIFDVFPVDKRVTGFYVADVVGHGMAAGLLTMFIKRGIVARRFGGTSPEILTPSETLRELNQSLIEQGLPNCQFVTACYGLFDHQSRTLQLARAGHPPPILFTGCGAHHRIESSGGLLGIFDGMEFPTATIRLHPGDKLLLYTDGLELLVPTGGSESKPGGSGGREAARADARGSSDRVPVDLDDLARLPIGELLGKLERLLDSQAGSLFPHDDVTALGFEVLPATASVPSSSTGRPGHRRTAGALRG